MNVNFCFYSDCISNFDMPEASYHYESQELQFPVSLGSRRWLLLAKISIRNKTEGVFFGKLNPSVLLKGSERLPGKSEGKVC